MDKLPETFSKMFVREGVVHAIGTLILPDSSSLVSVQPTSNEDSDALHGASSQARRHWRCTEGSPVEESANGVGLSPGQAEVPTVNPSLRASVSAKAKCFKDKYFSANSGVGMTDDLLHLKNLCARLNASIEEMRSKDIEKSRAHGACSLDSPDVEEELNAVLLELLNELRKVDGVSTFEFIGSGVVEALLNYFSCGTFSNEKMPETDLSRLHQQALKRFKSFIAIALPPDLNQGIEMPMTPLVQKLQSALSSLERFPVVLSHSRSASGSARLSYGLSALSQPFKLRLCRAPGEKSLRDYSSNVVLIDPLASLAAIEEFLWPRIQRGESGQKYSSVGNLEPSALGSEAGMSTPPASTPASSGPCHSTRSRSLAAIAAKKETQEANASSSKAKGKAILKSASEGAKGPRTRGSTRDKSASDKATQRKPPECDYSSEV